MTRYKHDCDTCTYLGPWSGVMFDGCDHAEYDLYHCGNRTVIARYGDKGEEYTSGLVFAGHNRALNEAKRRAEMTGVIFPEY